MIQEECVCYTKLDVKCTPLRLFLTYFFVLTLSRLLLSPFLSPPALGDWPLTTFGLFRHRVVHPG